MTATSSEARITRGDLRAEILAFEDVSVGFESELVLQDLTFNVRRGEVAGLVALDGRGKSTLVRCAAGVLAPSKGRVVHEQRDVYAMTFGEDQRFRKRTAVVFEGGALSANRTIFENVAFPLRYHEGSSPEDTAALVTSLLARTGYSEATDALPWQVSARGRRLAAFARALVRDPELVIVDRFFEALEHADAKRLMELVLELNVKSGTSFLLVGELEPVIFQVAERVLVLEGGRIVAHGFKKALYKIDRIREAFETGRETDGLGTRRFPTGSRQAAEVEPEGHGAAEVDEPEGRESDRLVVVTPDPDVPSAEEAIEDGDAERTLTMPPEAAAAMIAEARARADDKVEAEARAAEAGEAEVVRSVEEAPPPARKTNVTLDRRALEARLEDDENRKGEER